MAAYLEDDPEASQGKKDVRSNEMKLVEAVGHVLKNHSGFIRKFEIKHVNFARAYVDIDKWILHLSNCPVREFVLVLWGHQDDRYKVHPSLPEWKGLISLELCKCSLDRFPLSLGGFKTLKTLNLHSTPVSQEIFEYLGKSCPFLEILSYCHTESYFRTLKIDAPRLFRFKFKGIFDELKFMHIESLAQVCFCMDWSLSNKSREMPRARASNLMDFSWCLANVKTLHIKNQFLKYLIHGYVPERLPSPFSNMTTLAVEMDPTCRREFEAVLCILRSFPSLHSLTILFRGVVDDQAGSTTYFRGCLHLPEIHRFEVCRFSDRFSELSLIELILLASPKLQRLSKPPQAKATMLHRESCRGTIPEYVHLWLNRLSVPYIPQHIRESPPEPQEV